MIQGFLAGLKALGVFLGIIDKEIELHNTPEMKKRDEAQKEIKQDDADIKAIAEKDSDHVERGLS